MIPSDPAECASFIYKEALGSLMAHSIRAVVNQFRKRRLALDVLIAPDKVNAIGFDGSNGRISLLRTRYFQENHSAGRVSALIFIHRHANKNMARVCIAHELFHLLNGLTQFEKTGNWSRIEATKQAEVNCDRFAAFLCKAHDDFNRDEGSREKHIYFPNGSFEQAVTDNASERLVWPDGFKLDENAPFYNLN